MSDLLRDVDDMMRQERLMTIWRTYGNYIIGAILALIVAVGLSEGYKAWYTSNAEKHTNDIQVALNAKDPVTALTTYANDQSGNTAAVANLLAAQKMLADGKNADAVKIFGTIRNDARANTDLRDLATLMWVRGRETESGVNADELLAALKPLMRDDGLPWAWSARLESAVITADLKKDPKGAIDMLTPMLDNQALPYTQTDRARALVDVYRLRITKE